MKLEEKNKEILRIQNKLDSLLNNTMKVENVESYEDNVINDPSMISWPVDIVDDETISDDMVLEKTWPIVVHQHGPVLPGSAGKRLCF